MEKVQDATEFSYLYEFDKYEDEDGYVRRKKIPKTAYQWWIQERSCSMSEAEMYFECAKKNKVYQRDMWLALFDWATPDLWCEPDCQCPVCRQIAIDISEEFS